MIKTNNLFSINNLIIVSTFIASALVFSSCSNDDDSNGLSLKETSVTLHFGDTYQIEASSAADITYTSEDEFHATVSNRGLVTAGRVGETNIDVRSSDGTKKVKVTVEPEYNVYPEPDVKFGDSKSSIISKFGTPDIDEVTTIGYYNYSSAASFLVFDFDSSNNLYGYVLVVNGSYLSDVISFLDERYALPEQSGTDDTYFFFDGLDPETASTAVGISLNDDDDLLIVYMPNTLASSESKAQFMEKLVNKFKVSGILKPIK